MDDTTRSLITLGIVALELGVMYYAVTHAEQLKYWIKDNIIDKINRP